MDPAARPTRVRFLVIAVTTLAAVLLYLDRVCMAFTGTYAREDLGLSGRQLSVVLGAFFFAYALAQVPTGWLSDRFGARRMLAVYILAWSVLTAGTALAQSFAALLAARLLFGVAQAGAYPTAAALLGRWVPPSGRGTANSVVALGGRLGGAAAPALTAVLIVAFVPIDVPARLGPGDVLDAKKLGDLLTDPTKAVPLGARLRERLPTAAVVSDESLRDGLNRALADPTLTDGLDLSEWALPGEARSVLRKTSAERSPAETERLNRLVLEAGYPETVRSLYGLGWRPVMLTYGALGLLAAVAFWAVVRDRPRDHPWANAAEADLIERGRTPESGGRAGAGIPLGLLAASGNLWLASAAQFFINVGWAFLVTLLPTYLVEAFQVPVRERGVMATVPLLVGCVGMFAGGRLTDALARRLGVRRGRALPLGLAAFVSAGACLICPRLPTAWAVVAALAVMAAANDLGVPAIWSFMQDVGGRHVGSALGWGNMWGNLGAALSPVLLTLVQERLGWGAVFLTCTGTFVTAGVCGLLVDASHPLTPRPADQMPES
jgi:sugar phosphate permease